MNVVMYARSATGSVAEQLRELRALCEREGHRVLREFVDEGVSGHLPLGNRSEGSSMMAFCREGSVEAVIVLRRDRLSRTQQGYRTAESELLDVGVQVIPAAEPIYLRLSGAHPDEARASAKLLEHYERLARPH